MKVSRKREDFAILCLNHKFSDHVVSAYLRLKLSKAIQFTIRTADRETHLTSDLCGNLSDRLCKRQLSSRIGCPLEFDWRGGH